LKTLINTIMLLKFVPSV